MANLHAMSRTANGTVDTSASADKKDKLAVSDGETAKGIALHNYEDALKLAWDKRYRVFSNPEYLRAFIEELARQVNRGLLREPFDAVEAAACAEYYINVTIHLFADGCGKCAMMTAAWLLMRGGHALPAYPGREDFYKVCRQPNSVPVGSEEDEKRFADFLRYYRGLFGENAAEPEDPNRRIRKS